MKLKRTHMCGQLRMSDAGKSAILAGWVNTYRDQGKGLIFIDIRDRTGLTQVVFDLEDASPGVVETAKALRREDVIAVSGEVRSRGDGAGFSFRELGPVELKGFKDPLRVHEVVW